MNYTPGPTPKQSDRLAEFLDRQLRGIAASTAESTDRVFYRTLHANQESLTAAVSANFKVAAGNVVRFSTSSTVTLTGIFDKTPYRERIFINTGSGVLVLKSEGTESSASYRFLLSSALWNISANASASLWYDPVSHRHRGIGKT